MKPTVEKLLPISALLSYLFAFALPFPLRYGERLTIALLGIPLFFFILAFLCRLIHCRYIPNISVLGSTLHLKLFVFSVLTTVFAPLPDLLPFSAISVLKQVVVVYSVGVVIVFATEVGGEGITDIFATLIQQKEGH